MRVSYRICLTAITATLLQGGCIDPPKAHKEAVQPAQDTAERMGRVASNWQIRFQKQFAASSATEAYGFFSESSYADAGQYLILLEPSGASVVVVSPAGKEAQDLRPLDPAIWEKVATQVAKADALEDLVTKHFDGIKYEYVHWQKPNGGIGTTKRVLIAKPEFGPKDQEHLALIKTFTDLKETKP